MNTGALCLLFVIGVFWGIGASFPGEMPKWMRQAMWALCIAHFMPGLVYVWIRAIGG